MTEFQCPVCDNTGFVEHYDMRRERAYFVACDCLAGDQWAERNDMLNDPHEQAAERARNNDFADTGGKDWT